MPVVHAVDHVMQERDLHLYEAIRNPLNIKQERKSDRESLLPQNGSDNEHLMLGRATSDIKLPMKRNQSGILSDK